jgi:periplasmic protein TonB
MFEDSLVESRGFEVSSSKRWTTLGSIGLQVAVVGVVIALPLLYPEGLPSRLEAPKVLRPLMPTPPVPVVQTQRESSASPTSMGAPSALRPLIATLLPGRDASSTDSPQLAPFGSGMRMPDGLLSVIGDPGGHGPNVSVVPVKPVGPVCVSSGVSQGMLIAPIRPVYPAIARAARVEGSVVVKAIISQTGTIERLHVLSGPQMLQSAAIDAIREARYRPFQLNGKPIEVQTCITVNFRM